MLGNVLIRPQLLDRAISTDDDRVLEMLMELGSRLIFDFTGDQNLLPKFQLAFEEALQMVKENIEGRVGAAKPGIEAWFAPLYQTFEERVGQGFEGSSSIYASLEFLLDFLSEILDNLQVADIHTKLHELVDILENDLGLTPSFFGNIASTLVDSITDELSRDYLSGDASPSALESYAIAANILTIKRLFPQKIAELEVPALDLRVFVDSFCETLTELNWDEEVGKIAYVITEAKEGLEDIQNILNLLGEGSLSINVNASSPATRSLDIDCQVSWYLTWFNEKVVEVPNRFNIFENLPESSEAVSFSSSGYADFLEGFAFVLELLGGVADSLQHGLLDIKEGNYVNPLANISYIEIRDLISLVYFATDTKGDGWTTYYKVFNDWGAKGFGKTVVKILTKQIRIFEMLLVALPSSFEQYPDHGWTWVKNNFLTDYGKVGKRSFWSELAIEVFLTLFTLPDQAGEATNYKKIKGLTKFFGKGFAAITAAIVGRKRYYSQDVWGSWFWWNWLGETSVLVGGLAGWTLAGAIASKFYDDYYASGEGIASLLIEYVIEVFGGTFGLSGSYAKFSDMIWEGNTKGGTLGLIIGNPNESQEPVETITFLGYPEKDNSPYHLPFGGETAEENPLVYCSATNLNLSKHNYYDNLLYAYQFSPKYNSDVLAMRAGTVVDFVDNILEPTKERTNYIVIRHDDPAEGELPHPDHDCREENNFITTYAWYKHGIQNSISLMFAAKGIPASGIIGAKVKQGDPLMKSGRNSEGINALQVYVGEGEETGQARTIPFVFKEVKGKGVPKKSAYYRSENVPRPPSHGLPIYHPAYHSSRSFGEFELVDIRDEELIISGGGTDGDIYKDLLIRHSHNGDIEIRRITGSKFNRDHQQSALKISANFSHSMTAADKVEIFSGIRESGTENGDSFVVLDPYASNQDGAYVGGHMLISRSEESTLAGSDCNQTHWYRKINRYNGGERKVFFEDGWENDCAPLIGGEYQIGSPLRPQASSFQKLFGYWAPVDEDNNAQNFGNGDDFQRYSGLALYANPIATGKVQGQGNLGTNLLVLEQTASPNDDAYNNHFIIIRREGRIIQYRQITDYVGSSRTATIGSNWNIALITGGTTVDTYEIGAIPYASATVEDKRTAYLAPDDPSGSHAPAKLPDDRDPYKYWTYRMIR
ncbi:MAG: hypothetical protein AAF388_00040 [Bacteroidota bacterium]